MKIKLFVVSLLLLTGCDNGPKPAKYEMGVASQLSAASARITVTKLYEFRDERAYGNWRGVYLVRDKLTGREWVGISGIGISEAGSHSESNGKTMMQVEDER